MTESSGRWELLRCTEEVERDTSFCERQARADKAFHTGLHTNDLGLVTRLLTVSFAACEEPSVRAVTLDRYLGLRSYWQYTRADLEAATAASHASSSHPPPYVRVPRPPRPPPHERDCPDGPYFDAAPPPLLLSAATTAAAAAAWVSNPLLLSQGVQSLRSLMMLSRGACDAEEAEELLLSHTHAEWASGSSGRTSSSDSRRDAYVSPDLQQVVVDDSACATTALQCAPPSPHLRKRSSMGRPDQHESSAIEQEPLLGS